MHHVESRRFQNAIWDQKYKVLKVTLLDYILLMTRLCHLILDNICLIFYLLYFDWMLAVARGLPI